jgi:hypothetical protein
VWLLENMLEVIYFFCPFCFVINEFDFLHIYNRSTGLCHPQTD